MNRDDFSAFVSTTLEDVVQFAEEKAGQKLPRKFALQWLGTSNPRITEDIVGEIVKRVFIDDEHIYPSVDLGVVDLLEDGSLLIMGNVAGHPPPRPFGRNRTGREGPFVPIVGISFLNKLVGVKDSWSPDKPFSFITPDMNKARSPWHVRPNISEIARQTARGYQFHHAEQEWGSHVLAVCSADEGRDCSRLRVRRPGGAIYQAVGHISTARSYKESHFNSKCGFSS